MVKGLDLFKDRFAAYASNYVLIGGAACYIHEEISAMEPRATKDLDLILVVEALTPEFVSEFWRFIREGRYEQRQRGKDKHECFRFLKPQDKRYPTPPTDYGKTCTSDQSDSSCCRRRSQYRNCKDCTRLYSMSGSTGVTS